MDVTLIGHATVLVEAAGLKVLVDPLFGLGGPLATVAEPAIPPEKLLNVDAVLMTHDHRDHLDPGFFPLLPAATPILVPAGFKWPDTMRPPTTVDELEPWESRALGGITVTCVPATHRGPACGFVLEADGRVLYIAGDTRYDDAMPKIGRRWSVDTAILPVRPAPAIPIMDAEETVEAVRALRPHDVVPYHHGLKLPMLEGFEDRAAEKVVQRLRSDVPDVDVRMPRFGQRFAI